MRTIKILLVLLALAVNGWAAPQIASDSGTYTNGENITITSVSGHGFGTKTAAPLISSYDNATSANNFVNMTAGNAPGGSWEYRDATVVAESASLRRTAMDQASKYIQCPLLHGSPYSFLLYSSGTSGSTFYNSFWIYYDMSAWNIGGSGANSKFWRHYVAGAGCASWYIRVLSGAGNYVDYAGLGADYAEDDETYENHWTYMGYSQWIHVEIYEYVGTVNGNDGFVRTLINGRAVSNWTNGLLNNNHSPATPAITNNQHCWGQVSGPAYGDNDVLISEVYLDNTPARVFISSKNDITGNWWAYGSAAHNEIQVPSSWSDSSITFTLNQGTFGDTDTAYLYVVDSAGAISPAYEITLSGEGGGASPAPPTLSNVTISGGSFR